MELCRLFVIWLFMTSSLVELVQFGKSLIIVLEARETWRKLEKVETIWLYLVKTPVFPSSVCYPGHIPIHSDIFMKTKFSCTSHLATIVHKFQMASFYF